MGVAFACGQGYNRRRMKMRHMYAAAAWAVLLVGGCSFADNALLPSLAGEQPSTTKPSTAATPPVKTAPVQSASTAAGGGTAAGAGAGAPIAEPAAGQPTGTYVGQKVQEFRAEATRLQSDVTGESQRLEQLRIQSVQNAEIYHTSVGAIGAKLQTGTTPGNPILVQQWNEAQTQLLKVNSDLAELNKLQSDVAASAKLANYLLDSIQASFSISGAVDEDHRQLRLLKDDVSRTTVEIDRLLNQLAGDVARQNNYLAAERSNLTTLAFAISNGEAYGASLATRVNVPVASAAPPGSGAATGRPLVVIRFDKPRVAFEQPLFEAVNRALERRPNAAFDIVAVAPSAGSPTDVALNTSAARRDAETVLRALTNMGMPPDRVSLSATTSQSAQSPEVHLYVR